MINQIGKKALINIQLWIFANVIFELMATGVIGVSISNLIELKSDICVLDICLPRGLFFSFALIFLLLHPVLHSITLYRLLKETNVLGMGLSNKILLKVTNQNSSFENIPDDEKLKITTIEAQRITSSVISPAARIFPSILTTIAVVIFCGVYEPLITLIIFCILTTYYLLIVFLTRNLSRSISSNLTDLISLRFRNIRALLQNRSYFKDRTPSTLLYQKVETETVTLAAVDALGQVVAQSPRKGLEAIIFLLLIIGVYTLGQDSLGEASTISIIAVLTLKVLPNFQAIYHSIQQIRNNFSAYTEASQYFKNGMEKAAKTPAVVYQNQKSLRQIKIKNLSVSYLNEYISYPDIKFDLTRLNIVIGRSGCGKSTLLKTMSNQIRHSGTIEFPNCIDVENIVYYGQAQTLLPGTLLENLYPYLSDRLSDDAFSEVLNKFKINEIMKDHNLSLESSLLSMGNRELSDGQKQRILLARTFLTPSDLILLDEPTSNLDASNSEIITESIRSYCKTKNIIMTSHNIYEYNVLDQFITLS